MVEGIGRSSDTEASMTAFGEQDDVFWVHDGGCGPEQQLPATLEARALVKARSVESRPPGRAPTHPRAIRSVASACRRLPRTLNR